MKLAAAFLLVCGTVHAEDAARQLARILTEKGVLTGEELVTIEQAGADDAVRMLSAALYRKGILTQSEMARVSGPVNGPSDDVRFLPAVASTVAVPPSIHTAQAPAATTAGTTQIPEVTAASHFPVQIYGTVLWNSFYNTAGTNIEDIPLVASKTGTDPNGNFGMTVRQSRFGLRYQGGPEVSGAKLSGTVEMDLLGGSAPFANGVNMDLVRLPPGLWADGLEEYFVRSGPGLDCFLALESNVAGLVRYPGHVGLRQSLDPHSPSQIRMAQRRRPANPGAMATGRARSECGRQFHHHRGGCPRARHRRAWQESRGREQARGHRQNGRWRRDRRSQRALWPRRQHRCAERRHCGAAGGFLGHQPGL